MPMTANRPGIGPCLAAASAAATRRVRSTIVSARLDNWVVVVVSESRFSIPKRSRAATPSISRRWKRLRHVHLLLDGLGVVDQPVQLRVVVDAVRRRGFEPLPQPVEVLRVADQDLAQERRGAQNLHQDVE